MPGAGLLTMMTLLASLASVASSSGAQAAQRFHGNIERLLADQDAGLTVLALINQACQTALLLAMRDGGKQRQTHLIFQQGRVIVVALQGVSQEHQGRSRTQAQHGGDG